MKTLIMLVIGILVIVIILTTPALAQTQSDADKTLSPYFYIENGDPSIDQLPLKDTQVHVAISGFIANVTVTQIYKNDGSRPINAQYIFPASTQTAVHGMKMIIGNDVITAKIKEKETAKKIYDKAKKQGKNASLLEQKRPNVFSMRVANLMPGQKIVIELKYTELLVPVDGTYGFVYPTVVGPRFTNQLEDYAPIADKWVKSPYLHQGKKSKTRFGITTTISSGIPLQGVASSSHKINIYWKTKNSVQVNLKKSEKNAGNRDYILNYRLQGKQIEAGLMLYEGNDENFFLLMAEPPERVTEIDIPAREYIFVVDVSGSMNGFPLDISKDLLRDLIGNLRETDTFNVILFAGASSLMSPTSVPATQKNIDRAIDEIDNQDGGGGTMLLPAMKMALGLEHNKNASRSILVITDGYISAEKDVFEFIEKNLDQTNIFSFGIGSSVNRYLIEGMARAGHGEPFIVTEEYMAKQTAQRFRKYVQSPVLTNIKVEIEGFNAYDVEPLSVPDLFANRPLIVYGKYKGGRKGRIKVSGISGTGEYVKIIDLKQIKPLKSNDALRYLWARKRIERLSDHGFGYINDDQQRKVIGLGIKYNLLTKYTSFVAVRDTVVNKKGNAKNIKQPLPLPHGVSNYAVGNPSGLSSASEPEMIILFLVMALVMLVMGRKKYVHGHVQ